MKIEIVCIFLLFLSPKSVKNLILVVKSKEISTTANAVNQVIQKFYIKSEIYFNILFVKSSNSSYEIFDEVLLENKSIFTYNLYHFTQNQRSFSSLTESTIFFIHSCEDFAWLHSSIELANWAPKNLKFLIYIENCPLKILQTYLIQILKLKKLNIAESSLEVFEFLLINDGQILYLASIEWFTETACNDAQLVVLNSFDKRTQKWTEKLKNYEKFRVSLKCFKVYNQGAINFLGEYRN